MKYLLLFCLTLFLTNCGSKSKKKTEPSPEDQSKDSPDTAKPLPPKPLPVWEPPTVQLTAPQDLYEIPKEELEDLVNPFGLIPLGITFDVTDKCSPFKNMKLTFIDNQLRLQGAYNITQNIKCALVNSKQATEILLDEYIIDLDIRLSCDDVDLTSYHQKTLKDAAIYYAPASCLGKKMNYYYVFSQSIKIRQRDKKNPNDILYIHMRSSESFVNAQGNACELQAQQKGWINEDCLSILTVSDNYKRAEKTFDFNTYQKFTAHSHVIELGENFVIYTQGEGKLSLNNWNGRVAHVPQGLVWELTKDGETVTRGLEFQEDNNQQHKQIFNMKSLFNQNIGVRNID